MLHLDHLAALLDSAANAGRLKLSAVQLGRTLHLGEAEASAKLHRLLQQHKYEWTNFMGSLGRDSFLADWALSVQ